MQTPFQNSSKKYISSIEASEHFNITNDYVSLLCRQGKIGGKRIGRQWFVEPKSLEKFLNAMQAKKSERNKGLSTQLREEYATSLTTTSAPTISQVRPAWEQTFAPKRSPWFSALTDTRVESHTGIALLFALPVFMFGLAFSVQAFESALVQPVPLFTYSAAQPAVVANTSSLVATASYLTRTFHVPGAYTDTSSMPPAVTSPSYPISAKEAKHLVAFAPLFAKSFADTASDVWSNSLGLTANAFVASVYEMGDESNQTVAAEFNMASVWDAWTTALASFLYPVHTTSAPTKLARQLPSAENGIGVSVKQVLSTAVPVVQKTISVSPAPIANLAGYVTQSSLSQQLSDITAQMRQLIYNQNAQSTSSLYASLWGAIALSQRIDTLPSTVTINNSPIVTQQSIPVLSALSGLLGVGQGGTGTSTAPIYGQMLIGNSFGGYDLVSTSSLGISSGSASLSGLTDVQVSAPAFGNLLEFNGSKWINAATSTLGISGISNLYASTTIGNGTQTGGLTVSGGATTTGNSLLQGALAVTGSTTISALSSGLVGSNNGLLYGFASSSLFGYAPLNPTRLINTAYPLQGGGNLTADRTLTLAFGTTTTNFFGAYNNFSSLFASSASTTNATTTNLNITSLTNGGLAVDANGRVYAAATSTLATISGTLSLTQLANQAANTLLVNGTSASAPPTAIATSSIFGTGLGGQVLAWSNGVPQWIASTTYAAGAGISTSFANNTLTITNTGALFAYPFPASATSSLVAFDGGLTAIGATSTNFFSQSLLSNVASFGQTGTSTFTSTGFLGIGSTSPFAKLSVQANNGDTNATLFAIGSSTQSATTTLFSILNTGNVGIGTSSPVVPLDVVGAIRTNSSITLTNTNLKTLAAFSISGGNGLLEVDDTNGTRATLLGANDISYITTAQNKFGIGNKNPVYPLDVTGASHFTSYVDAANFVATSTSGTSTFAGLVGVGTTTPFAQFAIHANNGSTNTTLFAIASSTQSATTTLFNISNTGLITATGGLNLSGNSTVTGQTVFSSGALAVHASSNNGSTFITNAYTGNSGHTAVLPAFASFTFAAVDNAQTFTATQTFTGGLGVGTTTPFADLAIQANNGDTNTTLFAIGSSTQSATTTLFNISNTGAITTTGSGDFHFNGTGDVYLGSGATLTTGLGNTPDLSVAGYINTNGGINAVSNVTFGSGATMWTTIGGASNLAVSGYINANSGVVALGGSASTPGYQLFSSNNSGIFETGSNSIAGIGFSTQGLERGRFDFNGNFGIGTTTPYSRLSLWGTNTTSGTKVFEVTNSASTTSFSIDNAGFISAGSSNGNNPSNLFTIDTSSGTTTISNLLVGNIVFDTDAGLVGLSDIPVDSNVAANVRQAQSISVGGNPLITASAIANGSGGLTNFGVAIGTSTNPYSMLQVWGPDAASSTSAFAVVNSASTTVFAVFDGGNAQLSGTLTQNSDQRLKTNIVSLDGSSTLANLIQLNPVTFNWIDTNQGSTQQVGFIAQQVQQIFPNLVSTTTPTPLTPNGTLGVNYIGFVAPIIEAIKTLVAEVNGFATQFTTQKLCVADSSGATTCITKSQLDALLQQAGQQSAAAASAPAPSNDTSAPAPTDDASSTPDTSMSSAPDTSTSTSQ